jgi:predicted nuclease of predicted toxin-antitoxin system
VFHVYDVGLRSRPDSEVFAWAQANGCLIITFDTDFANGQDFPVGRHYGVIRLRLKYTTEEEAMKALEPIFDRVDQRTLRDRVIIFKNGRIRVRPGLPPEEQA